MARGGDASRPHDARPRDHGPAPLTPRSSPAIRGVRSRIRACSGDSTGAENGSNYTGRDMSPVYDCRDEAQLLSGMRHARQALSRGELVVLPPDTVYGIAAEIGRAHV